MKPQPLKTPQSAQPKKQKKILVIDDDREMTFLMKEILSKENYEVCAAHTDVEAMGHSKEIGFDLILLDIYMPFLSGFQLCDLFKRQRQHKNIPVIMVTGLSGTDTMEKAYQAGADSYLKKPFRAEELLAMVRKILA